ncbi:MAG: Ig-like domain-containing protein, partial [Nitrospirae bacterium]|nr:Ig-like domain-containing protein [Fimbriimonadaceae bacterium]
AEGPPVIVGTSPRHFDLNARGVRSIAIDFTTGVVARAGDFAIVGSRTGSVKFGVHTSMSGRRATLSLARPLQPDTYRVTVRDSLTGLATGWKLDGENLGAWPSGDGLPGGSAEFVFLVKSLR